MKRHLPINVHGYIGFYHYSQYGQLFLDLSSFFIPLVSVPPSAPAAVNDAGSGIRGDVEAICTKNRTNARSGLGGMSEMMNWLLWTLEIERMLGWVLKGMPKTMDWLLWASEIERMLGWLSERMSEMMESVVMDNVLAARDNVLAVDNNGLTARIGKRTDINNRLDVQAGNQADTRLGNRPDTDLIMTTTDDIRADLIKNFNNNILILVSAKLSCIVLNKHSIDSSIRILANVINHLFENLTPLLLALSFSPFFLSLPALTTYSNFGNISTTFIYYILI